MTMTVPSDTYWQIIDDYSTSLAVPRPTIAGTGDMIVVIQVTELNDEPLDPEDAGWEQAIYDIGNGSLCIHWGIYGVTIPAQSTWQFTSAGSTEHFRIVHVFNVQGDVDDTCEWDYEWLEPPAGPSYVGPTLNTEYGNRERIYFNIGVQTRGEVAFGNYVQSGSPFPAPLQVNHEYGGGGSSTSVTYGFTHVEDNAAAYDSVPSGTFYRSGTVGRETSIFTVALLGRKAAQTDIVTPVLTF